MMFAPKIYKNFFVFVLALAAVFAVGVYTVSANTALAVLPFSQNWSDNGLITTVDDWSGVYSIMGYLGDYSASTPVDVDPQTLLSDYSSVAVDVIANLTSVTNTTGGVAEFQLADPTIAMQGSGAADAPFIKIFLNTTGMNNIRVAYNVRDIDSTTDNAVQQVALHYRVGSSGNFTNVAAAYIADATTGPSLATLVTPVNVILPAAASNQPHVELRIMTTNATGNDEWVGIDDISVTANYAPTGFSLLPNLVLENQPTGTTIGTMTGIDPNVGDTHTFEFVTSCSFGGADNVYFSIVGNTLQTAAVFDYESQTTYFICIRAVDDHGLVSDGVQYIVSILDIADETPPSVSIEQASGQPDPTNASPINFTAIFSEPVTGFDETDISVGGTAGATTATVTEIFPGDGTTYNVAVSGMALDGDVTASVIAEAAEDGTGNKSTASTSTDNTVTYSTDVISPAVTVEQASGQPDPTNVSPINFTVEFSEPVTGFDETDIDLGGTAGATTVIVTEIFPSDGTTYNVAVSGMTSNGDVTASVVANAAKDILGNDSTASTGSDNVVTFSTDTAFPIVLFSANTIPANGSVLATGPSQIQVEFNENVKSDFGTQAANNTINYLLVEAGTNGTFDTASCLGGRIADDVLIAVNAASYNNSGAFTSTLVINGGMPLGAGVYRLFVCGTTSIEDLIGNELNDGVSDTLINFTVSPPVVIPETPAPLNTPTLLPVTGFPKGELTRLPTQPLEKTYASYADLKLVIPSLSVSTPIVGVPLHEDDWDVTWLGADAGWLNGTAFPTWNGNSVITAHVWDAYNQPGPFHNLKKLKYGDVIQVHAFGQIYTYEVRETKRISPKDTNTALKHEEKAWLTLITCEDYRFLFKTYSYRRMVRAVLVNVTPEK